MHFMDYSFIFLLALVLFGPKKLPEIGRQMGKLLAEFRRASNEFKFQIQEELRNMEEEERRKKLAEQQAALAATTLAAEPASEPAALAAPASAPEAAVTPSILPPSTGTTVSTSRPYATPVEPEGADVDDAGIIEGTADAPAPTEFSTASGTNGSSPEPVSLPMTESVSMAEIESGVPGNHHG